MSNATNFVSIITYYIKRLTRLSKFEVPTDNDNWVCVTVISV